MLRTFGGLTTAMTGAMVRYALDPLFNLLTGLPWWMVCGFAALIGWAVSRRWTLPLAAFLLMAAIGVIGMWDPAMNTLSQVLVAVASSVVLAVPLGIWSGKSDRVHAVFKPILDTMQTMPQFVYLVPAVALFGVGRVPGRDRGARLRHPAGDPAHRPGIRQVPKDIVEASDAFGATSMQTFWKVQLPAGASVDPAGREPDGHHGLLGRDHRRSRGRHRTGLPRRRRALPQPRHRRWWRGSRSC